MGTGERFKLSVDRVWAALSIDEGRSDRPAHIYTRSHPRKYGRTYIVLGLRRDRLHVLLHLLGLALVLQPEGLVLDDALRLPDLC